MLLFNFYFQFLITYSNTHFPTVSYTFIGCYTERKISFLLDIDKV